MTAVVVVFALLVIVYVSQSARIGRAHLTGPIIFVAVGAALGLLVSGGVDSSTNRTIAEVTLALVLFHDAAQLQPRELRSDSVFTARLLLIGLPLTIGAGYLVARGLFPSAGTWAALLVAATLAPTDAGLGAATVLNPVVPVRVRRILNAESGLNDGMATPVVLFAVAAAAGAVPENAAVDAVRELAVGAVVGVVAGYALRLAHRPVPAIGVGGVRPAPPGRPLRAAALLRRRGRGRRQRLRGRLSGGDRLRRGAGERPADARHSRHGRPGLGAARVCRVDALRHHARSPPGLVGSVAEPASSPCSR